MVFDLLVLFSVCFVFYDTQCCVLFWVVNGDVSYVRLDALYSQQLAVIQPKCELLRVVEDGKLAGSMLSCDVFLNAALKCHQFCDFSASG